MIHTKMPVNAYGVIQSDFIVKYKHKLSLWSLEKDVSETNHRTILASSKDRFCLTQVANPSPTRGF